MTDSDKLVAWLREAADELEKAHALLDHLSIPRSPTPDLDYVEYTLASRISLLNQAEAERAPAEPPAPDQPTT